MRQLLIEVSMEPQGTNVCQLEDPICNIEEEVCLSKWAVATVELSEGLDRDRSDPITGNDVFTRRLPPRDFTP
jgi:hypothetical protein